MISHQSFIFWFVLSFPSVSRQYFLCQQSGVTQYQFLPVLNFGLSDFLAQFWSSAIFVHLSHVSCFEVWKILHFRDARHCMSASSSQLPADVHRRLSSGSHHYLKIIILKSKNLGKPSLSLRFLYINHNQNHNSGNDGTSINHKQTNNE